MKAVILAAGRGTRLGALTESLPKPMIDVCGRPVVEHIMRGIQDAGIDDFILVTRYLGHKISEYFGDGSRIGARIQYVEQPDCYGTGAALLAARGLAGNGPVLMTFADVIASSINYSGAVETFIQSDCSGVMTLNWVEDPWRGAAVVVNEDQMIEQIVEKPPKGRIISHWNSAGIFVFKPLIFDYLAKLDPSNRGEYELPDALNTMLDESHIIRPYYLKGSWKDVGTPEDLAAVEEILREE